MIHRRADFVRGP
ncbi:hypothetical protein U9M48_040761 [Paspalum notatum var. saurae]|uniref:Uncharacterized protein n=1 Tax=Paspalum notatum var. saurae TaxID=547442 RepID=A0AAQ3UMD7_PASNO